MGPRDPALFPGGSEVLGTAPGGAGCFVGPRGGAGEGRALVWPPGSRGWGKAEEEAETGLAWSGRHSWLLQPLLLPLTSATRLLRGQSLTRGSVSAGANYNKTINSGGHLCSWRAPDVLQFRPVSGGRQCPGRPPLGREGRSRTRADPTSCFSTRSSHLGIQPSAPRFLGSTVPGCSRWSKGVDLAGDEAGAAEPSRF